MIDLLQFCGRRRFDETDEHVWSCARASLSGLMLASAWETRAVRRGSSAMRGCGWFLACAGMTVIETG